MFQHRRQKRLKDVWVVLRRCGVPDQLRALVIGVAARSISCISMAIRRLAWLRVRRKLYGAGDVSRDPIKPFSVYPWWPVVDRPDIDANTLIGELLYKYADRGVRGLMLQCPGFTLNGNNWSIIPAPVKFDPSDVCGHGLHWDWLH